MASLRSIDIPGIIIGFTIGAFALVISLLFVNLRVSIGLGAATAVVSIVVAGQPKGAWNQISRGCYLGALTSVTGGIAAWNSFDPTRTLLGISLQEGAAAGFGLLTLSLLTGGFIAGRRSF